MKCEKPGIFGLFAQCCGIFKSRTQADAKNMSSQNAARRITYYDDGDSINGSYDEATGSIVLKIGGVGGAPFAKKGKII